MNITILAMHKNQPTLYILKDGLIRPLYLQHNTDDVHDLFYGVTKVSSIHEVLIPTQTRSVKETITDLKSQLKPK